MWPASSPINPQQQGLGDVVGWVVVALVVQARRLASWPLGVGMGVSLASTVGFDGRLRGGMLQNGKQKGAEMAYIYNGHNWLH